MSSSSIDLAVVFDRATPERLRGAERLVASLPGLMRGHLRSCDLGFRTASRFLVAVVHVDARAYTPEMRARLAFWSARAGGLASSLTAMGPRERSGFEAQLELCDVKVRDVEPARLCDALAKVLAEAGASPEVPRGAPPALVLSMDVGGPGWQGVEWRPESGELFLPGPMAPPVGDELRVSLRYAGSGRPAELRACVTEARSAEAAAPGAPAGFVLRLSPPPPPLAEALARCGHKAAEDARKRAAPRYPVKGPVQVSRAPNGRPAARAAPAPAPGVDPGGTTRPTARIEYATDEELHRDWLENLSHGGAFIRSAHPAPVGSRLSMEMRLPGGAALRADSTVVFANEHGMGVKFDLDARAREVLDAAVARLSARPRRALVVEDDATTLFTLADALGARGFEVLTARDGTAGMHLVADELLTLDLLLTDLRLPGLDGEALVRTIRQAGGESDLAIVVVTGTCQPGVEERLLSLGADAVLEKALGPDMVAQAADAALERKRLERAG